MKFGRLPSLDGVDFTLPPDHPDTADRLTSFGEPKTPPTIRLGTPRWADKGFVGTLYPPKTPARAYLDAYGRQFETIELNATYYRADEKSSAKWADSVGSNFRFCPKLSKVISHQRQLVDADDAVDRFIEAIRPFGEKLGPCWILLPDTFSPREFAHLERFVTRWPRDLPLGVELRHPEWFRERSAGDELFRLFDEHDVIAIVTDVAGRRDVLHQRVTSRTVILRFVGNGLHPSDFERIEAWADRLGDWSKRGVDSIYLFLHQPNEADNVAVARHAIDALGRTTGASVHPIRPPEPPAPAQLSF